MRQFRCRLLRPQEGEDRGTVQKGSSPTNAPVCFVFACRTCRRKMELEPKQGPQKPEVSCPILNPTHHTSSDQQAAARLRTRIAELCSPLSLKQHTACMHRLSSSKWASGSYVSSDDHGKQNGSASPALTNVDIKPKPTNDVPMMGAIQCTWYCAVQP